MLFLTLNLSYAFSSECIENDVLFGDSIKAKFNFKSGIKENGIYTHFGKISDFKCENNKLKKGWYVVTECLSEINEIQQETVRYFNFGFPDADYIIQSSTNFYFLTVYFSDKKEDAINKVMETKAAGVPHVWIQFLEE